MKAESELTHVCDDQKNVYFCLINLKEKTPRRLEVPYESAYFFDSLQIGNQIYFTGGGMPAKECNEEEYYTIAIRLTITSDIDPIQEKLSSMNIARANHTMVALDSSQIFVIGGCNSKAEIQSCEQYKESLHKWNEIASLNEKKKWVSVCTFASRYLYCFGGSTNKHLAESDAIETLDTTNLAAKTWTNIKLESGKELWKGGFFYGLIQLDKEMLLIFGGIKANKEVDDTCFYYPLLNKIVKGPKLNRPDVFFRSKPAVYGNEIIVAGTANSDLHIYKKDEKIWSLLKKSSWNPDPPPEFKAATT